MCRLANGLAFSCKPAAKPSADSTPMPGGGIDSCNAMFDSAKVGYAEAVMALVSGTDRSPGSGCALAGALAAAVVFLGCKVGNSGRPPTQTAAVETARPLWPTENKPTPYLTVVPLPADVDSWLHRASPEAEGWQAYCTQRFVDGVMHLQWWGHEEFSTGALATGKTTDGITVISYFLGISTDEWYLAEAASSRPLPDRDWSSTFGDLKRSGRASLFGELHGHAARIVASATDPFKRENFFAAFMPQVKSCVGDKRGVHRDTFVFPDAGPDSTE